MDADNVVHLPGVTGPRRGQAMFQPRTVFEPRPLPAPEIPMSMGYWHAEIRAATAHVHAHYAVALREAQDALRVVAGVASLIQVIDLLLGVLDETDPKHAAVMAEVTPIMNARAADVRSFIDGLTPGR